MNGLFIENPSSNPQLAKACGIEAFLPNQQPHSFTPVMPAPVAPAIDTATVQELTKAINNMDNICTVAAAGNPETAQ